MPEFRKVLVANRGEIAVRVLRALREMHIPSVAIFSEVDRRALHVEMADEAVCVGPAPSAQSYLNAGVILREAQRLGVNGIHPGYGFLSENAAFARACTAAGIKFIGPRAEAMDAMGSKTAARRAAVAAGAPVVPGVEQGLSDPAAARRAAASIGYPVLLKAAAGGGGKGMRRVDRDADLIAAMRDASHEAQNAFGSSEIYLEKLVVEPRHIEIQVLGDEHGHVIHLGERECSIQRRHQKVIEECPSPLMAVHPKLRQQMGEAALKIARAANYCSAGTVEFLADPTGNFYFLEMNTRLQVEHPVTEWVTGLDLVRWQIRIAAGERLTLNQSDVDWRGSSIECRVYAEDPDNHYFPCAGTIRGYREPHGAGVRVDGGAYDGWTVPMEYDPLLAKLSVWAGTRAEAVDRMQRALREFHVLGITTNLPLLARIMGDADWRAGRLDTSFLNRLPPERAPEDTDAVLAAIAAAAQARPAAHAKESSGQWLTAARKGLLR